MSIVYRWRAECPIDNERLLALLPPYELLKFDSVIQDARFPDTETELTVWSLSLEHLQDIMRQVPDGHIMVQTVQPKDRYTGERNYNLW